MLVLTRKSEKKKVQVKIYVCEETYREFVKVVKKHDMKISDTMEQLMVYATREAVFTPRKESDNDSE